MLRMFALFLAWTAIAADTGVLRSRRLAADFALTADPEAAHWRTAPSIQFASARYGEPHPESLTRVRSLWTPGYLSFLFIANYETQWLKPGPPSEKETWGIWDFDVCEVFIGHDLERPNLYKEFEVSPRGEWVDLDVDKSRTGKEVDWTWNSRFRFLSRVDEERRIWICEMQIPWSSIDPRPPAPGRELRLNLYRIEGGPDPRRKYLAWRPVNSPSFHTPEAFGRLVLAGE